jgi:hypothetical protein
MAAVCMSCGASEGAKERPVPLRTVACDSCWQDAVNFPDREPERVDFALAMEQLRPGPAKNPREGNAAICKDCGASCAWHRTENGRWLLLEPGGYPTDKVHLAGGGGSRATAQW